MGKGSPRVLVLVLLLLALTGVAEAKDDPPALSDEALAVLRMVEAGDEPNLRTLLQEHTSPYTVAHELCVHGKADAAWAYARSSPTAAALRLRKYVSKLRRNPPSMPQWKLRAAALELGLEARWFDIRRRLADVRAEEAPKDVVTVLLLYAKAEAARHLERTREACDHHVEAAGIARSIGWWQGASEMLGNAYRAAQEGAHIDRMLDVLDARREIYELLGERKRVGWMLLERGCVYANLGQYDLALDHFEPVLEAYGDVLGPVGPVDCKRLAGLAHNRIGQFADALDLLTEAYATARELGRPLVIAEVGSSLGGLLVDLGDLETAEKYFEASRRAFEEAEDDERLGEALGNLGLVAWHREDLESAETWWQRARDAFHQAGDRLGVVRARIGLASVERKRGRLRVALDQLLALQREVEDLKDAVTRCDLLNELAFVYWDQGRQELALDRREAHVLHATRIASVTEEVKARGELARLHLARKQYADAIREARKAAGRMGVLFDRLPTGRAAFTRERMALVYAAGLAAAVATDDVDAACYFLEAGRAGALLTALEGRQKIREDRLDGQLLALEKEARTDAALAQFEYQRVVDETEKLAPRREAKEAVNAAQDLHAAILERIQLEGGLLADILYPEPLEREAIQGGLAQGDVLVTYGRSDDDTLVALVLGAEAKRVVNLGPFDDADGLVGAVLETMRPDAEVKGAGLADLRRRLVEPLDVPEGTRRVLVSPVGRIAYLPPTLLFPDVPAVYVPSATTIAHLHEDMPKPGRGVLAVGDPVYEGMVVSRQLKGALAGTRGGFRNLPHTRFEAEGVGTTVLLDTEATETRVRAALARDARWRSVHFACHGVVHEARPSYCALVLTPSAADDGYLRAIDVFRTRIDADLAVLSACETGRGRLVRAEGIVGLMSAFLVAGAPQVLVSLWQVEDESTKELMLEFYRLWNPDEASGKKPLPAAVALRKAQAHVRDFVDEKTKKKKWAHPYYWAGWALWGAAD